MFCLNHHLFHRHDPHCRYVHVFTQRRFWRRRHFVFACLNSFAAQRCHRFVQIAKPYTLTHHGNRTITRRCHSHVNITGYSLSDQTIVLVYIWFYILTLISFLLNWQFTECLYFFQTYLLLATLVSPNKFVVAQTASGDKTSGPGKCCHVSSRLWLHALLSSHFMCLFVKFQESSRNSIL